MGWTRPPVVATHVPTVIQHKATTTTAHNNGVISNIICHICARSGERTKKPFLAGNRKCIPFHGNRRQRRRQRQQQRRRRISIILIQSTHTHTARQRLIHTDRRTHNHFVVAEQPKFWLSLLRTYPTKTKLDKLIARPSLPLCLSLCVLECVCVCVDCA